MTTKQKRFFFYTISYLLIGAFTILSLMINIQTMPFIEKKQKVIIQTKSLQQENKRLLLQITSANSLENIDAIAKTRLSMHPPKHIRFISSP